MEYWHDTYGGLTMVVITKLIMLGIAFVCSVTLVFIILDFVADKVMSTSSKKINRVHFYVARDKDGIIYLYIGKPKRRYGCFLGSYRERSVAIIDEDDFKMFGLNQDDFKDIKWEDEPVEVFLNMGD